MTGVAWEHKDLPRALLVIAPHPDDEVLGCGRLMRRVASAAGRVVIAWMTDGGGSHGDLDPDARRALVDRRRGEALEGVLTLGVAPEATVFLGQRDGGLAQSDADALLGRLQALCDTHAIDTVAVTAVDDGHADHRAAFAIASRLSVKRLVAYPVSARYDGEPYTAPEGALVIEPEAGDDKRGALRHHRSQRVQGGARYPLSDATIERFCAESEVFIPVRRAPL